jgi:RNA polymerase sigma-70 factor (ECF subfamily)
MHKMNNNKCPDQQWLQQFISLTKFKLTKALSHLLEKDDIEDVLQECYLKVFELYQSDKVVDNYQALLYCMARNNAISKLRHRKVVTASIRAVYDADCERLLQISNEEKIKQQQETELLNQAIDNLPEVCRRVFILRKIENKTHAEIADLLQISTKTVENHITRGIKACRQFVLEKYKSHPTTSTILATKKKVS